MEDLKQTKSPFGPDGIKGLMLYNNCNLQRDICPFSVKIQSFQIVGGKGGILF